MKLLRWWIDNRSPDRIPVVAMTADERERRDLSELAATGDWELRFAATAAEALATLQRGKPAVILCDRDLQNLDWRELFEEVAASRAEYSLILTSSVYDDSLWDEVVQRGGYGVLCKPLQPEQALSAVNLAWLYARSGSRVATG